MVTAGVVAVVEDVVSGIVVVGVLPGCECEWGLGRRLGVGGTGELPRGFSMFSF